MIAYILFLSLAFVQAHADTAVPSLVSISGYSNYTLDTSTTPPTLKIYGGYVDGTEVNCVNSTVGNTQTCNSCNGSGLTPCNKTMVYPDLKFHLEFQSKSSITGKTLKLKNNTSGNVYTPGSGGALVMSSSGSNYWIDDTWSKMCLFSGLTDCTSSFSLSLTFGYGASASDSTFDESITVQIYFAYRDPTTNLNYTDCTSLTGTSGDGFCGVNLTRGDAKAYINTIYYPSTFPATSDSYIEYSNVIFFYSPRSSSSTDDQTVMSSIKNNTSSVEIAVDKNKTPPISDNRIRGLTNNLYYCFVMASKDIAGNIYAFTPTSSFPTTGTQNSAFCAQPAPVVGLLDDKKCFIATAAFGSELDPHVEIFRQFRNKILYSSKIGTKLVEFYYEKSPQYAAIIRDSELLRFMTRMILWPLLVFAQIAISIGLWPTLMILALSFVSTVFFWQRREQKWMRS